MTAPTALVLVSHSADLAKGAAELASEMAPDVVIRAAGGTGDGRLGTSFAVVERAIADALDAGSAGVVVLGDLGSARMTAESVIEAMDDTRVRLALGPFVEGAVAAAVEAQGGGSDDDVTRAVVTAAHHSAQEAGPVLEVPPETRPAPPSGTGGTAADGDGDGDGGQAHRAVTVRNPLGLHARPAALLAQLAQGVDATVTINGVDGASLLKLMSLGLVQGSVVELVGSGPQAQEAVDRVAVAFEDGFGEL